MDVELPLSLDLKVLTTEYEYYTAADYMTDVGALLALILFFILCLFGLLGFVFVLLFTSQLKQAIGRKYKEAEYMHHIQKHLVKFRKIHQALCSATDDEEYKAVVQELEVFLDADYEAMTFVEIEKLHR